MDPTTTLVTFMLQTEPSVKSVRLIGSWDNFSSSYPMERDSRRDRGQWKGCYAFKNITCDDDRGVGPPRDGGLKMGNTYHYYYELDGTHETHDPTRPSTRHCPYMPGQTVNTLFVPIQQTLRKRSASLSSMRTADFMTMDPRDKYTTPRPAPRAPLPSLPNSARNLLRRRSSSRSLSPAPSWRRFFRRSPERGRAPTPDVEVSPSEDDARSLRSLRSYGSGSRSRDISPESLSRFLRDEAPEVEDRSVVAIPEENEESEEEAEADDDENFASAGAEGPYPTGLAPPPVKRTVSSPTPPPAESEVAESPVLPDFERRSRFSFSSVSSCASSVVSSGENPVVYGLAEERDSGYGLPGTASSKGVAPLGVEDMAWMADVIGS